LPEILDRIHRERTREEEGRRHFNPLSFAFGGVVAATFGFSLPKMADWLDRTTVGVRLAERIGRDAKETARRLGLVEPRVDPAIDNELRAGAVKIAGESIAAGITREKASKAAKLESYNKRIDAMRGKIKSVGGEELLDAIDARIMEEYIAKKRSTWAIAGLTGETLAAAEEAQRELAAEVAKKDLFDMGKEIVQSVKKEGKRIGEIDIAPKEVQFAESIVGKPVPIPKNDPELLTLMHKRYKQINQDIRLFGKGPYGKLRKAIIKTVRAKYKKIRKSGGSTQGLLKHTELLFESLRGIAGKLDYKTLLALNMEKEIKKIEQHSESLLTAFNNLGISYFPDVGSRMEKVIRKIGKKLPNGSKTVRGILEDIGRELLDARTRIMDFVGGGQKFTYPFGYAEIPKLWEPVAKIKIEPEMSRVIKESIKGTEPGTVGYLLTQLRQETLEKQGIILTKSQLKKLPREMIGQDKKLLPSQALDVPLGAWGPEILRPGMGMRFIEDEIHRLLSHIAKDEYNIDEISFAKPKNERMLQVSIKFKGDAGDVKFNIQMPNMYGIIDDPAGNLKAARWKFLRGSRLSDKNLADIGSGGDGTTIMNLPTATIRGIADIFVYGPVNNEEKFKLAKTEPEAFARYLQERINRRITETKASLLVSRGALNVGALYTGLSAIDFNTLRHGLHRISGPLRFMLEQKIVEAQRNPNPSTIQAAQMAMRELQEYLPPEIKIKEIVDMFDKGFKNYPFGVIPIDMLGLNEQVPLHGVFGTMDVLACIPFVSMDSGKYAGKFHQKFNSAVFTNDSYLKLQELFHTRIITGADGISVEDKGPGLLASHARFLEILNKKGPSMPFLFGVYTDQYLKADIMAGGDRVFRRYPAVRVLFADLFETHENAALASKGLSNMMAWKTTRTIAVASNQTLQELPAGFADELRLATGFQKKLEKLMEGTIGQIELGPNEMMFKYANKWFNTRGVDTTITLPQWDRFLQTGVLTVNEINQGILGAKVIAYHGTGGPKVTRLFDPEKIKRITDIPDSTDVNIRGSNYVDLIVMMPKKELKGRMAHIHVNRAIEAVWREWLSAKAAGDADGMRRAYAKRNKIFRLLGLKTPKAWAKRVKRGYFNQVAGDWLDELAQVEWAGVLEMNPRGEAATVISRLKKEVPDEKIDQVLQIAGLTREMEKWEGPNGSVYEGYSTIWNIAVQDTNWMEETAVFGPEIADVEKGAKWSLRMTEFLRAKGLYETAGTIQAKMAFKSPEIRELLKVFEPLSQSKIVNSENIAESIYNWEDIKPFVEKLYKGHMDTSKIPSTISVGDLTGTIFDENFQMLVKGSPLKRGTIFIRLPEPVTVELGGGDVARTNLVPIYLGEFFKVYRENPWAPDAYLNEVQRSTLHLLREIDRGFTVTEDGKAVPKFTDETAKVIATEYARLNEQFLRYVTGSRGILNQKMLNIRLDQSMRGIAGGQTGVSMAIEMNFSNEAARGFARSALGAMLEGIRKQGGKIRGLGVSQRKGIESSLLSEGEVIISKEEFKKIIGETGRAAAEKMRKGVYALLGRPPHIGEGTLQVVRVKAAHIGDGVRGIFSLTGGTAAPLKCDFDADKGYITYLGDPKIQKELAAANVLSQAEGGDIYTYVTGGDKVTVKSVLGGTKTIPRYDPVEIVINQHGKLVPNITRERSLKDAISTALGRAGVEDMTQDELNHWLKIARKQMGKEDLTLESKISMLDLDRPWKLEVTDTEKMINELQKSGVLVNGAINSEEEAIEFMLEKIRQKITVKTYTPDVYTFGYKFMMAASTSGDIHSRLHKRLDMYVSEIIQQQVISAKHSTASVFWPEMKEHIENVINSPASKKGLASGDILRTGKLTILENAKNELLDTIRDLGDDDPARIAKVGELEALEELQAKIAMPTDLFDYAFGGEGKDGVVNKSNFAAANRWYTTLYGYTGAKYLKDLANVVKTIPGTMNESIALSFMNKVNDAMIQNPDQLLRMTEKISKDRLIGRGVRTPDILKRRSWTKVIAGELKLNDPKFTRVLKNAGIASLVATAAYALWQFAHPDAIEGTLGGMEGRGSEIYEHRRPTPLELPYGYPIEGTPVPFGPLKARVEMFNPLTESRDDVLDAVVGEFPFGKQSMPSLNMRFPSPMRRSFRERDNTLPIPSSFFSQQFDTAVRNFGY